MSDRGWLAPHRGAALVHRQRRALARYLHDEVAAFSPRYRAVLGAKGLAAGLEQLDDLRKLPLTTWDDVGDGSQFVLRPDATTVTKVGPRRMRWAAFVGTTFGQAEAVNRKVFEPAYKPVRWMLHAGVPVASTTDDLDRLAELGRRSLERAGVGRRDVMVVIDDHSLPATQVQLGATRAGISHLARPTDESPALVAAAQPQVLAGTFAALVALLGDAEYAPHLLEGLHTLLVWGIPLIAPARQRLAELAPGVAIVSMWAPPGVRAAWVECRAGESLHTWPDDEVLDIVDPDGRACRRGEPGEIVWTAIGWRGTVLLRLATGAFGAADAGPCPACGEDGPRLWPMAPEPLVFDDLDEHPSVDGWLAFRTVADDGTFRYDVRAGIVGRNRPRTLAELREAIEDEPGVDVRIESVTKAQVDQLLADHGDRQVVDPPTV